MDRKELAEAVRQALHDLEAAMRELSKPTTPDTPLPRRRRFVFVSEPSGSVHWPAEETLERAVVSLRNNLRESPYLDSFLAERICQLCRWQPRKILRAIRRIEAATAWCVARTEGRRRAAQEILRQQARAVETLEAMAAMRVMARMGGR